MNNKIREFDFQEAFDTADFRFLRIKDDNLDEIIEFQKTAHIDQFNFLEFIENKAVKKRFIWQYFKERDDNQMPFVWFARYKNEIIGQICFKPHEVKIEDNLYKAGWLQDLIVSPDFRNKGIGYFLIKYALKELNGHADLIFAGGTNKYSYPLLNVLGFIDIGILPRYIKILSPLKKAAHEEETNNQTQGFNLDFDEAWSSFAQGRTCVFKRDKPEVRWRFMEQPLYDYKIFTEIKDAKISGYIVLRNGKMRNRRFKNLKTGVISDLFYQREDKRTFNSLLGKAITYFKNEGMNLVRLDILAPGVGFALLSRGFLRVPSTNKFLFFLLNKDLEAKKDTILLKNSWFITFFDTDFDLW